VDAGKSAAPTAAASQASAKTPAPPPPGTPDVCSVQFRHVEQRLRELGATYYFLETFGEGYRFYCKVALGTVADSTHTRDFQAMNADPLEAMKKVLDQVESFRGDQGSILGGSSLQR
jgi:hypothetical protein